MTEPRRGGRGSAEGAFGSRRAAHPAPGQTRTVGLVTLPGAFVGMLLPVPARWLRGAVQLFVLIAHLAVQTIAVGLMIELVARGRVVPAPGRAG